MIRSSSASEAAAEDSGTPAERCSATGMKGLGRAGIGQASSVSPITHRWSNSSPADSSTPSTWIGTSGASGWNSVSAAMRARRANASSKRMRAATRSSAAKPAIASWSFFSVWNSAESSGRSPGKPIASSSSEIALPHSAGRFAP